MKLTKPQLTQIIRGVINEEADTISMDKLIHDRVMNMNPAHFEFLFYPPKPRNSAYYEQVKKLLVKVTGGIATSAGLQKAIKKHDTLWDQVFGRLAEPTSDEDRRPKGRVIYGKVLLHKLATIAVGK